MEQQSNHPPKIPQPAPAPKPDPVTLLQMQLERLKKIEDILNFIKSTIIIGAILYLFNILVVACNLVLGSP